MGLSLSVRVYGNVPGGSFDKTMTFMKKATDNSIFAILEHYAQQGVAALSNATPVDSGLTASSWDYEIVNHAGRHAIIFHNTHLESGKPIAILIQYGHATGTGGYVEGRDFINPVIKPLFDQVINDVWKAVNRL